jgi:hypothetical protein
MLRPGRARLLTSPKPIVLQPSWRSLGIVLAGRKHVVRLNRRRFRPRLKAFGLRGRSASGTHCGVARCC